MFEHKVQATATVVLAQRLKDHARSDHDSVETWRFVIELTPPGSAAPVRVAVEQKLLYSRYRAPAAGESVTVEFPEGHPDKAELTLKHTEFDRHESAPAKPGDEERARLDAEARAALDGR